MEPPSQICVIESTPMTPGTLTPTRRALSFSCARFSLFSFLQAGNSVSLVTRSAARAQLEACQKTTAAAKKAAANAAITANLAALTASVSAAMEVAEQPFVVVEGILGGDTKALRKAIDTLASASNGQTAALALSVDEESGKLMGVAHVPSHLTDKLPANEWLMAALAPCGGKGGGKADAAQGQAASGKEVRDHNFSSSWKSPFF